MHFRYVAYDRQAGVSRGRVEAPTADEARAMVALRGVHPLRLVPVRVSPSVEELFPSVFRVGTADLVRFARHVATMVASGGSLLRALDMLRRDSRNRVFAKTMAAIRESLDAGDDLSAALAKHPRVFSPLFVSVIEVGEHTGRLAPVLEQMADLLEVEREAKQKAVRTMMYPVAIVGLSAVTMGVLMVVAVPPMIKVLDGMGADIPLLTRVTIGVFGFLRDNVLNLVLGMMGVAGLFGLLRLVPGVKDRLADLQIRTPLVGPLVMASDLSRFSRTMAMLLEAGVPLTTALDLATHGCGNRALRRTFVRAQEGLSSGRTLTSTLEGSPVLPRLFLELVMTGEEGNSLRRTMTDAANAYQKLLAQRLNGLLGVLEPASTLVVGGMVGVMAFSMFLPIYAGLNMFK